MRLALAAGEHSGDRLAAAVLRAMVIEQPELETFGLVGPALRAAGAEALADLDQLNVMGLAEVVRHVPRLARLRRGLAADIIARKPALFAGFDAPDFNLGLARRLRRDGIVTAQVVAPSVWAWRRYRIRRIAASLDLLLTLFPFEPELFAGTGLDARFIGHPLADEMPLEPDRIAARGALGLDAARPVIALLPGSRPGELARHARLLVETVRQLQATAAIQPCLLLAAEADRARFVAAAGCDPVDAGIAVYVERTRTGLIAADVALAASGTVTLEALLARTPMVVFYRLAATSYRLARALRLVKSRWISLPNVLADTELVPERIQQAATPERLAADALAWLDDSGRRGKFEEQAEAIHRQLACNAAGQAAQALLERARLR
ncbi:MAG: lipid-A-disaccharide synthase [Wenzhouxiangellaceae bacterium]|nr:lipid-A-disaccharide synthase [Wenzhouxiangellaceae bacterium]